MPTSSRQRRPLPPLGADTAYLAAGFEYFEYSKDLVGEGKSIVRLHLSNRTIIDLPATDEALQHLALVLCNAYPSVVDSFLKMYGQRS